MFSSVPLPEPLPPLPCSLLLPKRRPGPDITNLFFVFVRLFQAWCMSGEVTCFQTNLLIYFITISTSCFESSSFLDSENPCLLHSSHMNQISHSFSSLVTCTPPAADLRPPGGVGGEILSVQLHGFSSLFALWSLIQSPDGSFGFLGPICAET